MNTNNNNKSLVPHGTNLSSNVGKSRFTQLVASMFILTPITLGVFVGLILSDGYIGFASPHMKNARFVFVQSIKHNPYFWFVFNHLSHYCSRMPYLLVSIRKGVECKSLNFYTRALPCITALYYLFYINGIKIIPRIIYELLTPIALAHWIMGDGLWERSGVVLCTDSFTVPDVVRLMNVLMVRYRLDCTLRFHRDKPRIYIRAASMPLLRTIVVEHMDPSMLYKIGL